MFHSSCAVAIWDNGNTLLTRIRGEFASSCGFPISRGDMIRVAGWYRELFQLCKNKFHRKLYLASPPGGDWKINTPEAYDMLVEEIMSLARDYGFTAIRTTQLFLNMKKFHVDSFHFGVNRMDSEEAPLFHSLWKRAIDLADSASAFLCVPETWGECMKTLPNNAILQISETLGQPQGVIYDALGTAGVTVDPEFKDLSFEVNPFPLAIMLTGCTTFL